MNFFYLMTVLLYLLSDTAALFLQSKTRVEPASYNIIVGDHSKCAYNNYTCRCTSRVIRALRFDWVTYGALGGKSRGGGRPWFLL